ncbi:hypothetical protein AALP_AA3G128400 [Arabis alpina]|uniref:Uncharacterized protein n=1 Tax=Arabis alpina TaxID=50452 RepID=A0A087H8U8_ARAAL|nr:hypothetical protein AALP_AA3G128400 [Arabis alpina]
MALELGSGGSVIGLCSHGSCSVSFVTASLSSLSRLCFCYIPATLVF